MACCITPSDLALPQVNLRRAVDEHGKKRRSRRNAYSALLCIIWILKKRLNNIVNPEKGGKPYVRGISGHFDLKGSNGDISNLKRTTIQIG